jgi:CheY-like chemotaxis protein
MGVSKLQRPPSGTRARGHIVLVVDDDIEFRAALATLLVSEGLAVLEAADGADALRVARAVRPDAILLDLSLPVVDGPEVARRLKSDPRTKRIPVIALTGRTVDDGQLAELQLSGLLMKPCLPEVLCERLAAVLADQARLQRNVP